MTELPRDVVLKIISYLDIDTRRSLGIYSKLRIPDRIKSKLETVIPHPNRLIFKVYSRVSLGPIKNNKYMYVIHSDFGLLKFDLHMDCVYSKGLIWYHPSVLDSNYNKIMLNCPLVLKYIEHNDENTIIYSSIDPSQA